MLIYRRTSILESTAQTLVNTVNCVGVMGKGIARSFKERDPRMFEAYKTICDNGLLKPGKLWLWQGTENWVLNFPTKIHWRNPSKLEWIEAGLKKFVSVYQSLGIREISFPRLGCGNGGLDWNDVRPRMEHYLSDLPIPIFIHDYTVDVGLPEHLEGVARELKKEHLAEPSFENFVAALRRAIDLAGNELVDLNTKASFSARMSDEGLKIEASNSSWFVEVEALRGIWVGLLRGLVTKEKISWSVADGGDRLISALSVLPQVRPVEIQRSNASEPELAIELIPQKHRNSVVPRNEGQYELTWG